jgi:hypothetical protein
VEQSRTACVDIPDSPLKVVLEIHLNRVQTAFKMAPDIKINEVRLETDEVTRKYRLTLTIVGDV